MRVKYLGDIPNLKKRNFKILRTSDGYYYDFRPEEHSRQCVSLRSKGKDIQLCGYASFSYILLKYIINNTEKSNKAEPSSGFGFKTDGRLLVINYESCEVEVYDINKHSSFIEITLRNNNGENLTDEEQSEIFDRYRKKYETLTISTEVFRMAKSMYEEGLFEFVD